MLPVLIRPYIPRTNGMIGRLDGRIADISKTTRFASDVEFEKELLTPADTYIRFIPQSALGHKTPLEALHESAWATADRWHEKAPECFRTRLPNFPRPDTAKYRRQDPQGDREDRESISRKFHLKYVLAVMNSAFARDWLAARRRHKISVYPDDWKQLPVAPIPAEQQQEFVQLVNAILAEFDRHGYPLPPDAATRVGEFEREIDERVEALYGLDHPKATLAPATLDAASQSNAEHAAGESGEEGASATHRAPEPSPRPEGGALTCALQTEDEDQGEKKTGDVRRPIDDYSRDELVDTLVAAIDHNWWSRDDAVRAAAAHLGFRRVGKNIRDAFRSAINAGIRRGLIECEGERIRKA